jgi:chromate transporter
MPPESVPRVRVSDANSSALVYSLWQLVVYALKLGTVGFGGPVALVGYPMVRS